MHQKWALAEETRQRATIAFLAGPYPASGIPIIPDVITLDTADFGVAYSKNRPVWDLIIAALPVTLLINLIAFPISYLIAVPTGVIASVRRGGWFDMFTGVLYLSLYSIPTVLAGVFAIGFLANKQYLGLFPVSGLHDTAADLMTFLPVTDAQGRWQPGWLLDLLWHVALPVLCLVYGSFAILSKQTRASMLDNLSADYVRTAKAKGVPRNDVVVRHVFRNSLLPLITMFVGIFPAMLAGSVVIEKIFSVPGMGSLVLEAISVNDRELMLADTLMIAVVNVVALLLADILYAVADPRVSYE
jgi:ABC-type dipeptide/oligopeptide/nickel transport system permease component